MVATSFKMEQEGQRAQFLIEGRDLVALHLRHFTFFFLNEIGQRAQRESGVVFEIDFHVLGMAFDISIKLFQNDERKRDERRSDDGSFIKPRADREPQRRRDP